MKTRRKLAEVNVEKVRDIILIKAIEEALAKVLETVKVQVEARVEKEVSARAIEVLPLLLKVLAEATEAPLLLGTCKVPMEAAAEANRREN